jgi:hypothetical protein
VEIERFNKNAVHRRLRGGIETLAGQVEKDLVVDQSNLGQDCHDMRKKA